MEQLLGVHARILLELRRLLHHSVRLLAGVVLGGSVLGTQGLGHLLLLLLQIYLRLEVAFLIFVVRCLLLLLSLLGNSTSGDEDRPPEIALPGFGLLPGSMQIANSHPLASGQSVSPPGKSRPLALAGRTNIGIRAHMRVLSLRRVEVVEQQAHLVVHFFEKVILYSLVVLDFYPDSVVFRLFPLRYSFYCWLFLVELVHELASVRTPALDLP